jgi:hypothetical protein
VVEGTTVEGAALASFARSAWSQEATVVAGTTGDSADVASVLLVDVGPACHCRADTKSESNALFACSACAHPSTVVAGTKCEDAVVACSLCRRGVNQSLW